MRGGTGTNAPEGPGVDLTVLLLTYTRKEFIQGAVRSILEGAPADRSLEILLVKGYDDADLDRWVSDQGGKVLHVPIRDLGPKYAVGMRAARGKILALLEDDDYFLTGKVTRIFQVFSDPQRRVDMYHHGFRDVDLTGKMIKEFAAVDPGVNASAMTFRREFLAPLIPWAERIEHNFDLFLAVGCQVLGAEVYNEPVIRSIRRQHAGQWSWTHDLSPDCLTIWKMIREIGRVDCRSAAARVLAIGLSSPTRRMMSTPRSQVAAMVVGLLAQFRWKEVRSNIPEILSGILYIAGAGPGRRLYKTLRTLKEPPSSRATPLPT